MFCCYTVQTRKFSCYAVQKLNLVAKLQEKLSLVLTYPIVDLLQEN